MAIFNSYVGLPEGMMDPVESETHDETWLEHAGKHGTRSAVTGDLMLDVPEVPR